MNKVRGIYDGKAIQLLEPVDWAPNTEVEIVLDLNGSDEIDETRAKRRALQRKMLAAGVISRILPENVPVQRFERTTITGKPISQTVIEDRR